jgi:hypothetical protein
MMNLPIHDPAFCPCELRWETWVNDEKIITITCSLVCCFDNNRNCRVKDGSLPNKSA